MNESVGDSTSDHSCSTAASPVAGHRCEPFEVSPLLMLGQLSPTRSDAREAVEMPLQLDRDQVLADAVIDHQVRVGEY